MTCGHMWFEQVFCEYAQPLVRAGAVCQDVARATRRPISLARACPLK